MHAAESASTVAAGEPSECIAMAIATAYKPGEATWDADPYSNAPDLPPYEPDRRYAPGYLCPECWELGTGYDTHEVKMHTIERTVGRYEIWVWLQCPICGYEELRVIRRSR